MGIQNSQASPGRIQYELIVNQATEIPISDDVGSAVLANPEYADILVQARRSLVVSGKKIGTTNLLVRDRDQNVIVDIELHVLSSEAHAISIFNGSNRIDYSCLDACRKSASTYVEQNGAPTNAPPVNVPK